MRVPEEIIKIAEPANTRDELIAILTENHIEFSDDLIRELCGLLEIPHGYNCPCCIGLFLPPKNKDIKKILPRGSV